MSGHDGKTRAQRLSEKQVARDLEAVLDHAPSRRYLMRLIDSCGIFTATGATDPERLAHAAGRRDVALGIIAQIESHKPGAFAALQIESLKLQQQQKTEARGDDADE